MMMQRGVLAALQVQAPALLLQQALFACMQTIVLHVAAASPEAPPVP
jgi:hypothetical protein